MTECRYPTCTNEPADGEKYCSTPCQLKYEHIKQDALEAKIDAEREARDEHEL